MPGGGPSPDLMLCLPIQPSWWIAPRRRWQPPCRREGVRGGRWHVRGGLEHATGSSMEALSGSTSMGLPQKCGGLTTKALTCLHPDSREGVDIYFEHLKTTSLTKMLRFSGHPAASRMFLTDWRPNRARSRTKRRQVFPRRPGFSPRRSKDFCGYRSYSRSAR